MHPVSVACHTSILLNYLLCISFTYSIFNYFVQIAFMFAYFFIMEKLLHYTVCSPLDILQKGLKEIFTGLISHLPTSYVATGLEYH